MGSVEAKPRKYGPNVCTTNRVSCALQLDRFIDLSRINPTGGNLALSIAINEALEVVRLPFVLATVPYVTRW